MSPIYNNTVDYSRVDVDEGGFLVWAAGFKAPQAVTVGNNIRFPRGNLLSDFSQGSLGDQAWLVHEVGHVYEHQTNPSYGAVGALFDRRYDYALDGSRDLTDYGWEQQPSILADYFVETQAAARGASNSHVLSTFESVISDYGLGLNPALSPGITNPPLQNGGGNAYVPGLSGGASGGFVLYPSSPNLNMTGSVYKK